MDKAKRIKELRIDVTRDPHHERCRAHDEANRNYIVDLEQENQRLREALKEIVETPEDTSWIYGGDFGSGQMDGAYKCAFIAEQALEETE